jgi:Ca2+-binding RTX toxin-like protein
VRTRSLGIVLGMAMAGTALLGGSGNSALAIPPVEDCFGKTPTIVAIDSVVRGTSRADVIYIPNGADTTVYGNGGNDLICSDSYQATVYGGAGHDKIDGVGTLYGDAGNDTITSEAMLQEDSSIEAYGGAGNDRIDVDDADIVDGGSGDDSIHADDSYEVHGGSGDDDMRVHESKSGYGDAGDDGIEIRDVGSLDCGSGRDIVFMDDDDAEQIRRCEIREEDD